ncbi:MAG: NmrA family NAD(P)-binding protein [Gammaproteobacteria bacterium]|nr:NmrA family NAD(P)-binding protein [Gammaproteobacteria bacterium]
MTILVIGATGNVGRPTVAGLLAKGESVRALSRSEEKLAELPDGVEGVIGDLETGHGLDAACAGVDKLFLITANGETETTRGLNAVQAATAAGVQHIVFLSIGNPAKEPAVPHYRAKLPVEEAIRNSGAGYTFLRPNFFMQTDMSVIPVIKEHGVYAMPIGEIGQNRVDTRDIADCAVRVLTEDGHAGADYHLHGPDTINGPRAAEVYAQHFGREVHYGGDDVDQWAKPVEAFIPPWLLDSLKQMFLGQQLNGGVADADAIAASADAVGHPLRTFEEFVAEQPG